MRWVVSCVAATVCAAQRAMGWGKHFKIRPPDKRGCVPHGVRSMWGAAPTVAVYPIHDDALRANEAMGTEGRILFQPPGAGAPHLSAFLFESWAGHGACRRACD